MRSAAAHCVRGVQCRSMDEPMGTVVAARPRRRWVLVVAGVVVVIVAIAGWVASRWDNSTTPISLVEAAEQFGTGPATTTPSSAMAEATTTTADQPAVTTTALPVSTTAPATTVVPDAVVTASVPTGVYRYLTTGTEGIDALSKPTHEYPAESAIIVTETSCGKRIEWTPLVERREWFEICSVDGGLRLIGYGGFHTFFNQDDERSVACPQNAWLVPPQVRFGEVSTATCEGSGLVDVRTTTVVRSDVVTIDGSTVPVTVVTIALTTSGDTVGTTTRELWLTDDGLPAVWIDDVSGASGSVVGTVNYLEHMELRLASLRTV